MEGLTAAILRAAEGAVPLALNLAGVMALFLGLLKVAEAAGMVRALARLLAVPLARLLPEVPAGHPALGAMAMNVAANLLGMGNAATPFGVKAMEELERLNPHRGVASTPQVLFLAINTAGLTLLPTKVIALRASLGAADPAAVTAPTLAASLVATVAGIAAARMLAPLAPPPLPLPAAGSGIDRPPAPNSPCPPPRPAAPWAGWLAAAAASGMAAALLLGGRSLGAWAVPVMVAGLLAFGWLRRVPVYEVFVEGAREGFTVAVRIIPYLVAILVAVAMLRASGALDLLLAPMGRLLAPFGVPPQALALAAVRTLSGSGAYGMLAGLLRDPASGPDSPAGILLGTIYGSTETTFYVLAVYFGAVGIRRFRHALAAGLIADAAGLMAAVVVCRLLYG